jgi:RimJ/RimL family protein N-acetyltransferase
MTSPGRLEKIDKLGQGFEVGEAGPEFAGEAKSMYDGFARLAISQGLPPSDKEIRDRWIDRLFEFGSNFLAWTDGLTVGHAAVIPDFDRGDGEFVIFVSEAYRNRGVGTALTTLAIEFSRNMGLRRLWLTVEAFNFRAIRLYRNAGFAIVDEIERERTMVLRL